jgi:hypothetical protein
VKKLTTRLRDRGNKKLKESAVKILLGLATLIFAFYTISQIVTFFIKNF